MNRSLASASGLLLLFALLVAINLVSNTVLGGARIDLTSDQLFTLSDGTKNILTKLDKEEPLRLRFYFSRELASDFPGITSYATRVEELLSEFEREADGGLELEIHDPEPFSETEDRAVQFGLHAAQVPGKTDPIYFGLAGSNSVGDESTIPFFQQERQRFLEYDLAKLIYELAHPEKIVLGILSSLPLEGSMPNPMNPSPPEPWFIADQLRSGGFETRTVMPTAESIPEDVTTLLIAHPKDLSDELLYAIDQFVLGGGRVVALVDPHAETEVVPRDPQNPMQHLLADRSSNLERLFEAWGVELVPDKIVADRKCSPYAREVRDPDGRSRPVQNVLTLHLLKYVDGKGEEGWNLSQDSVATSELSAGVNFNTAGALRPTEGATTELTPLIQASDDAMLIDKSAIQFQPDYNELLGTFLPTGERYVLAAQISGDVQSAFPDGPPASDEDGEGEADEGSGDHLTESADPINVIVVADADFLHDAFWARSLGSLMGQRLMAPFADNHYFLINALDALSGSSDLIGLRGRGGYHRPFTKVQELERQASERLKAQEDSWIAKLDDAERRIRELEREKDETGGSALILTPEQEAELVRLREEQVEARKELRRIRLELREDIENLGTTLKFANIGLMPLVVIGIALGVGRVRQNRRKRN